MQCEQLAREQEKLTQVASFNKMAIEQANFLHAPATQRIKLKGVKKYPEAEVMVFHCENTGKMMLRVIDLPNLPTGQHYEVWAQQPGKENQMVGKLMPPIRYDSLYPLSPVLNCATLEMTSVDPYTMFSLPVCMATLAK